MERKPSPGITYDLCSFWISYLNPFRMLAAQIGLQIFIQYSMPCFNWVRFPMFSLPIKCIVSFNVFLLYGLRWANVSGWLIASLLFFQHVILLINCWNSIQVLGCKTKVQNFG
jgi:hypothetical protein